VFGLVLLLLFTVVPAIEIGLFVVVGGQIGPLATVAVVIFTGVAGASLARSQGLRVLAEIQESLGRGAVPTDGLVEGAIILFGGALLLTPGFLTDVWGICCLLPPTRKVFAIVVKRWLARRVTRTGPGRVEMRGWHVWGGNVRPGPAAKEPRIKMDDAKPVVGRGPRTIDASFTVVDGDDPESPEQS